jgi:hypothetical protein
MKKPAQHSTGKWQTDSSFEPWCSHCGRVIYGTVHRWRGAMFCVSCWRVLT